jgi:hypothetical protein
MHPRILIYFIYLFIHFYSALSSFLLRGAPDYHGRPQEFF